MFEILDKDLVTPRNHERHHRRHEYSQPTRSHLDRTRESGPVALLLDGVGDLRLQSRKVSSVHDTRAGLDLNRGEYAVGLAQNGLNFSG